MKKKVVSLIMSVALAFSSMHVMNIAAENVKAESNLTEATVTNLNGYEFIDITSNGTTLVALTKNTHKNERLGQYAFNIFEIIIDKLYANLNIRISTENDDFNDFPDITDNQKVYDFSIKMLENIIKQLSAKNKKTDNIVVDKLIQFINDNFSKNISLQDAAESVFFNPAYCSRFFKEQTGENFSNYLLKVRMEHAVKLLKENKKINDISKECGYQSPGYFTRVFKDYYNCTPSEYLHNS